MSDQNELELNTTKGSPHINSEHRKSQIAHEIRVAAMNLQNVTTHRGVGTMTGGGVANANEVGLASVFHPECIEELPAGVVKAVAIEQLLKSLANANLITRLQVSGLLKIMIDHERVGSTALGKGLAMPHLRTEAVSRFVGAVGLAPEGIDFRSIDGCPTKLIFLVLGPFEQRQRHIELMGRLSALTRDKVTLMFLQGRRTPAEVHDYLAELDVRYGEDHTAPQVLLSPGDSAN